MVRVGRLVRATLINPNPSPNRMMPRWLVTTVMPYNSQLLSEQRA